MTFTDSDLRRLEEQIADEASRSADSGRFFHEDILTLLARLRAAEANADTLWKCNAARCEPWPCKEAKDKDEVWRKAAGK